MTQMLTIYMGVYAFSITVIVEMVNITQLNWKLYSDKSIYIYIYSHPQTDCFVLSEHFSVARHIGHSKPGSKPIQLYVRLSLRPFGQQAYHVWLKEFLRYLCSNSSSSSVCLFTFLYPIGYQSAQFFWRALYYASGNRKLLRQSAQPPWGSVYYVIHRQTVSFYQNSSVWLDT